MRGLFFVIVFILTFAGAASGRAQGEILSLPVEWFSSPPTPGQVKMLLAAAPKKGWPALTAGLYAGSLREFEKGRIDVAEAWYYVAAWADLLGKTQAKTGKHWMETVTAAGLLSTDLLRSIPLSPPDAPMADLISAETAAWLMSDRAFSASFFEQLSDYDYLPQVLVILQQLRTADQQRFTAYNQLGLAIALVYDSPPPRYWPHAQVTVHALPRELPGPLDAFNFLVDANIARVTLQKLDSLPVSELKFAVDLAAPFDELKWAQKAMKFPLAQLSKSYEAVRYREDRLNAQQYVWPGANYTLSDILSEGGICVDQAYFASQAGKAKGVPTLLFCGAGQDGRHAWFGYLGSGQRWVLDAGRYPEERFVTGEAIDPQTWTYLSDHDLQFLSEGFRKLPPYFQSHQYELFAQLYLRLGQKKQAAATARKAVNYERRNLEAWETLLVASDPADPKNYESLLREAEQAFQRYPDLNARFSRSLVDSLRKRGETSAADFEERAVARKNRTTRTDLAVDQAAEMMARVLKGSSLSDQLSTYKQVLRQYGSGAGVDFYDRVVVPFVRALSVQQHISDAKQALAQARATLKPETESQLDKEMTKLAESLK